MTTYYVSQTGNNTTGSSYANGKTTVTAGVALLSPADTLMIDDGTYDEQILNQIPAGTDSAHPTILRARNANAAILFPTAPNASIAVIHQFNRPYQTYDGLVTDSLNCSGGFAFDHTTTVPDYITVKNGTARNGSSTAFGAPTSYPNGILMDAATGCVVQNMDIFNFCGHGIYFPGSNGLIEKNRIRNWAPQYDISSYAIHLNPAGADTNTIRNNVLHDWYRGMIIQGDANTLYNNIVYLMESFGIGVRGGSTNTTVYFNTVYSNGGDGIWLESGTSDAIVRNNISYSNSGTDFNDQGTSTTADHNLTTDPLFVNAAAGDFHLLVGSAAIGTGVAIGGITTDFDVITRPDPPSKGAYEAPSGSGPTLPLVETFDAYSAATSISGLNLGDGWTQSWQLIANTVTVETAPAWMTGKALRCNSASGDDEAQRMFTAKTGSFSIYATMSSTTGLNDYSGIVCLDQSGGLQAICSFAASGDIVLGDLSVVQASFTANHPYEVEFNFDTVSHPNQFRVALDGGSYSAWTNTLSSFTSIAGLQVVDYSTAANTLWVDDISDTVALESGIPIDDFDAYLPGADLDGLNGGLRWGGAWMKVSGGAITVETAPAGMIGNAIKSS